MPEYKDLGLANNEIVSVQKTSGTGLPGSIDTYTITVRDGSTFTFNVTNGNNGVTNINRQKFTSLATCETFLAANKDNVACVIYCHEDNDEPQYNTVNFLLGTDSEQSDSIILRYLNSSGTWVTLESAFMNGEFLYVYYFENSEGGSVVPTSRTIAGISLESDITENALFDKMNIKGRYATLSALQTANPNHGYCYLVEENNHWYYHNGSAWTNGGVYQATEIAEDSVSIIDTKFYEKNSLNLLDKSTITRGHYIYTDGSIRDNAGYFYTDYIEVLPSEPYFMSLSLTNNNFYAFYDSDKNFISGGYTTNDYLVMPSTAKFIRVSMQLSILDYAYFSKFSTIKSGYIIDNNNINNNATNLKISKGKYNLFDKNKICKGWYKYYLSGETTYLASYCISDFIEITPSTTIYIKIPNQQMHISYFDENYTYVSGNLITDGSGTFVTPATAKYIILSFKWEYADIVMLSYSNIKYVPYYSLDELDVLVDNPVREKVIIKPDGVFDDIVDGFNYAYLTGNCDVYIEGVWELNDYLNKITPNAGIRIGNNNHYFFASGSKITFTYTGSDTNVSNVVSAFISQRGFGDFEMYNATIDCNNVRYCVHDDNGGVSSSNLPLISYTHKYINCNMKLTRPNTPENTHCIGAGIGEDGYVVIDGCLFNSVNSQNGDVSFHGNWNFNSYSIAGKFNMFITNCYFEHTLQLASPDPESTPKNLLFANNSISESIIFNNTNATKWNIKQWNNEIRGS